MSPYTKVTKLRMIIDNCQDFLSMYLPSLSMLLWFGCMYLRPWTHWLCMSPTVASPYSSSIVWSPGRHWRHSQLVSTNLLMLQPTIGACLNGACGQNCCWSLVLHTQLWSLSILVSPSHRWVITHWHTPPTFSLSFVPRTNTIWYVPDPATSRKCIPPLQREGPHDNTM